MVNRDCLAVLAYEKQIAAVLERRRAASLSHVPDRTLGLFVQEIDHLVDVLTKDLCAAPSRELLRHRVHVLDSVRIVRGDDTVADRSQGHFRPLSLVKDPISRPVLGDAGDSLIAHREYEKQ